MNSETHPSYIVYDTDMEDFRTWLRSMQRDAITNQQMVPAEYHLWGARVMAYTRVMERVAKLPHHEYTMAEPPNTVNKLIAAFAGFVLFVSGSVAGAHGGTAFRDGLFLIVQSVASVSESSRPRQN